jgi:ABC-type arginine transport system permease subunit
MPPKKKTVPKVTNEQPSAAVTAPKNEKLISGKELATTLIALIVCVTLSVLYVMFQIEGKIMAVVGGGDFNSITRYIPDLLLVVVIFVIASGVTFASLLGNKNK